MYLTEGGHRVGLQEMLQVECGTLSRVRSSANAQDKLLGGAWEASVLSAGIALAAVTFFPDFATRNEPD